MTSFGHLHPCGLVVLKKDWKYADFPKEPFKINSVGLFDSFAIELLLSLIHI